MLDEIRYEWGIAPEFVLDAVQLYDQAFAKKVSLAIESDKARKRVLRRSFMLDHAVVAILNNKLVGIAGWHTATGSLTSGIGYWGLVSELGFLKATRAALIFAFYERTPAKDELLMEGIAVDADARGKGIGSMLLDKVKEYAKANHFTSIRLDVIDTNPRAKKLYERKGFKVVKVERFSYLKPILGFSSSSMMKLEC